MNHIQRPNDKKHIALAYSSFTESSYDDIAYKEIIEYLNDNKFNNNYTYAIYTDTFMVKANIFLPVFHTYYLNSSFKYVILRNEDCYDLPIVYPHHKYYVYEQDKPSEINLDELKTVSNAKICIINSMEDIINDICRND